MSASTVPLLSSLTHLPIISPIRLQVRKSDFKFLTLMGSDMERVLSYEVTLEYPDSSDPCSEQLNPARTQNVSGFVPVL